MSLQDQNKANCIQAYREKVSKYGHSFQELDIENVIKFIDYIESSPEQSYFPIYKLREASGYDNLDSIISLVCFFSEILSVEYIYDDGYEEKDLDKESVLDYQKGTGLPVYRESGLEVEDFDSSNFSFYCNLDFS